jgi:hypothetical protein
MLAGRGHGEEGNECEGQLALSKGPARIGIRFHGLRADIPSKGLFHTIDVCALNITMKFCTCMCVLMKKEIPMCWLKINHMSGLDTCFYSWLTGLHGCIQL